MHTTSQSTEAESSTMVADMQTAVTYTHMPVSTNTHILEHPLTGKTLLDSKTYRYRNTKRREVSEAMLLLAQLIRAQS